MNAHNHDITGDYLRTVPPLDRPTRPQRLRAKDWPVLLDQCGLGWLLGRQFLVITHRGRRSGLTRRTGVMVLNEDPRTGELCVAAGSLKADWYPANPPACSSQSYWGSRLDVRLSSPHPCMGDRVAHQSMFERIKTRAETYYQKRESIAVFLESKS
jgi:hypothetical protein